MRTKRIFGWRLLAYIGIVQVFLKGAATSITMSTMLPLFKNRLGIEASSLQLYMMAVMVPWSVKPIMGLITDLTVLGDYHKYYWMLGALGIGVTGSIFSFVAFSTGSIAGLVICFTMTQVQVALFDLMVEATYSAVMRAHPYTKSDVVTLAQGCQIAGGMIVLTFVGALSDALAFYALFSIALVLYLITLPFTLLNWMGERPVYDPNARGVLRLVGSDRLAREGRRAVVILFAGIGAIVVAVVANTADPAYAMVLALLLAAGCIMGAYAVFPRTVAALALYQVIATISRPSLGSALDYFYTADAVCLPDGPHFSYAYYQTVVGIVSSLASLGGVLGYQWVLSGMPFRRVAMLTTVSRCLGGATDLWMVLRWNVAIGIPDALAYLVGEAMLEPVFVMLNYVLGTVLISKVVQPGMESSIYAFMAGIYNFSSITSRLTGALIYESAGIRTVLEPSALQCNFDALWWLIIVCHITLPMCCTLPAAWFLVPDVAQDQSLVPAEEQHVRGMQLVLEPDSDAETDLAMSDSFDGSGHEEEE